MFQASDATTMVLLLFAAPMVLHTLAAKIRLISSTTNFALCSTKMKIHQLYQTLDLVHFHPWNASKCQPTEWRSCWKKSILTKPLVQITSQLGSWKNLLTSLVPCYLFYTRPPWTVEISLKYGSQPQLLQSSRKVIETSRLTTDLYHSQSSAASCWNMSSTVLSCATLSHIPYQLPTWFSKGSLMWISAAHHRRRSNSQPGRRSSNWSDTARLL